MKDTNKKADANRDPLTCEPGAHPIGTGVGAAAGGAAGAAAAGAATGALAGSAAGPVGTGVGLAAGAVIGGLAGKAGGEAVNPTLSPDLGRYIDYTVVDNKNDKIGTVDAVWQDSSGQPMYIAVRTGWLGMGKAHVVPAQAADVSDRSKRIRLPFTMDQVKNAPAFECSADIDTAAEERIGSYYERHGYRRERPAAAAKQMTGQEEARVQLKEEEVKVGKREVEYGGVRLRKVVRTETVQQPVELKREEIVVERVPVTGAAAGSCEADFSQEEIYVPLRREEAVVQKEAHVREEVRLGKRQEREQKTISETVRKEDVEIEEGVSSSRLDATGERARTQKYEPKERSRK
jgi:uncharacterized protein (TIGR02271 family)